MIREWLCRHLCPHGRSAHDEATERRRHAIVAAEQTHAAARLADLKRAIEIQRRVEGRDGDHGKPA
jgi:hypothetical protein